MAKRDSEASPYALPQSWLEIMNRFAMQLAWQTILRIIMGVYWLDFSYQKWFDRTWVKNLLSTAAQGNYIPVYGTLLREIASPNWWTVSLVVMVLEAVVGSMILLGIFTRVAATIAALMSLGLILTFCFCNCPWTNDFLLTFWFYFGPFLLNVQLIFDRSSESTGLRRILK
jgi:uncharacterized membrane protein YphA (DoxX/SURF4 family)